MKCHGNSTENHKGHKHSPLNHMIHMIICCGLPMLIVGFLPLIARVNPGAVSFISKIVPFLCPIMMVGMIFSMMGGMGNSKKKSCCEDSNEESTSKQII